MTTETLNRHPEDARTVDLLVEFTARLADYLEADANGDVDEAKEAETAGNLLVPDVSQNVPAEVQAVLRLYVALTDWRDPDEVAYFREQVTRERLAELLTDYRAMTDAEADWAAEHESA